MHFAEHHGMTSLRRDLISELSALCAGPAAPAAKALGRPVLVALSRQQVFEAVMRRSETWQRIRLACDAAARLTGIGHETLVSNLPGESFSEPVAQATHFLYGGGNRRVVHGVARVHRTCAGSVRAPGEAVGVTTLENAMDELAEAAGMDPVVHAFMWSLSLNIVVFVVVSLVSFPQPVERLQGAQFVNVFEHSATSSGWTGGLAQSEDLMIMAQRIMGAQEAQALFAGQAVEKVGGQSTAFRAEQQDVVGAGGGIVVAPGRFGGVGPEQVRWLLGAPGAERGPVGVVGDDGLLVIVQPGP